MDISNRRLSEPFPDRETDDENGCVIPPGWGESIMWIFVVIYLFIAIAIVCDELFVPSLELISEKLGLSDDIAGATLMAAGGSAPELATSVIGTFSESDVGFGTIVGSAVFNVLFVIAMCTVATPPKLAPLALTWWPLMRDCIYYVITLALLAVWFSGTSPGQIDLWEALVQFILYALYIVVMAHNKQLEKLAARYLMRIPVDVEDSRFLAEDDDETKKFTSTGFRTGILRKVLGEGGPADVTVSTTLITKVSGDVDKVFEMLKKNDNVLDVKHLQDVMIELEPKHKDIWSDNEKVNELVETIDINQDGQISKEEFTIWYLQSEERLRHQKKEIFDTIDRDSDHHISVDEVELYFREVLKTPPLAIREAIDDFTSNLCNKDDKTCSGTEKDWAFMDYKSFDEWYEAYIINTKRDEAKQCAEQANGMFTMTIKSVSNLCAKSKFEAFCAVLMFPINFVLAITIPDCRKIGWDKYCGLTFLMSIVWIGGFSVVLVQGIESLGYRFNIPTFIMALTFLAAGTSVPDLLSSVVVARQGKGDMAVSSSIGSNIFDVTVGLPFPWLLYCLVNWGKPVSVSGGEDVAISITILLAMVIFVITGIVISSWKMSNMLGIAMMVLYVVYVVQEVLRALPFDC